MATDDDKQKQLQSFVAKTNSKVKSSLHRAIHLHTTNDEYDARADVLDYLQVKNGIFISYLIDLTLLLRLRLKDLPKNNIVTQERGENVILENPQTNRQCTDRLLEMKAALEKMRPLEKRMSYQIDKLLALSKLGAGTFAAVGSAVERKKESEILPPDCDFDENNPLSFKPDLQGMMSMFEEDDRKENSNNRNNESEDETGNDEEIRSLKHNLMLEKDENQASSVYQPPRHQAMPFEENEQRHEKEERLRKKERDRMQRSELAEVVRAQFTDAPEEEDIRGGAMLGKQREISKRLAQRDADVAEFEETHMIRLTMGKKEKKDRKRIMREEMSNLGAIADLGNVVAGVDNAFGNGERGRDRNVNHRENFVTKGLRKRKVEVMDHEIGRQGKNGASRSKDRPKNSYQKALYGGGRQTGKTKKKRRNI